MDEQNIIINVGRQIGSGGRVIARQLAESFGCTFYDRELLNLAARESGFSERFFEQNDERKGFLRSLSHVHVPLMGENNYYKNNFSQESLYQFQSDAIRRAAEAGSCVFVGRTADYVLRDFPNVVNIFVTARLEQRVERVARRHGLDAAAARKYIESHEDARSSYYNYYTGKRWGQAESYDLCINSSLLGIEASARLVAEFIRQRMARPTATAAPTAPEPPR